MGKARRFVLIGLGCCGALLAAGIVFEQWSRWRAPRVFPPPGELVEVDGKRTHLHCTGEGSPTVILEAGSGSTSAAWQPVQQRIADSTRVCSYDRAGLAWSDRRGGPRDAVRIADELHAVLRAASVPPPYVLVSHSLGGLLIRVFTHRYPAEVAGLVFVDPSISEQAEGDLPLDPPAPQIVILRIAAETGVLRLLQGRADYPVWVPADVAEVARAFGPRNASTTFRENDFYDQVVAQAAALKSFGDRPTIVLSAGLPYREFQGQRAEAGRAFQERLVEGHAGLASRSTIGVHRVVPDAAHFIQWDQPEAVISAVVDVVSEVRGMMASRGTVRKE